MNKKKVKILLLNFAPLIILLCAVLTLVTNKFFPPEGSLIFSAGGIFIGIALLSLGQCLLYFADKISNSAISILSELAIFAVLGYAVFLAGIGQIIAWIYHFFK